MKTLLRAPWLFVLLAGAGLSTAEAMVNPQKAQNAQQQQTIDMVNHALTMDGPIRIS